MGKRILVVDDSSFMRKRIRHELAARGHSVAGEAEGGDEAIEMFAEVRPDVVIMDIAMRDKDGITSAKEILENHPDAKILFYTILDDKAYQDEAKRVGAVGFLSKAAKDTLCDVLDEVE